MTRPATFACAWCGKDKALARTGRLPKFCSDWCRRQPEQAARGLDSALWHLESAARQVAHLTTALARYRQLEDAETGTSELDLGTAGDRVSAAIATLERFRAAGVAERADGDLVEFVESARRPAL